MAQVLVFTATLRLGIKIAESACSRKIVSKCEVVDSANLNLVQLSTGVNMKSIIKFVGTTVSLFAAASGFAFAAGGPLEVPEPGSLALVGVAVAALVFVARKSKK